mmetsp:Transcript_24966/g.22150  ORF Transcript_24966/g.22150 Transcript_24966/m.22150 type:complete len:125 (+) Transcript_24966:157-531(+)
MSRDEQKARDLALSQPRWVVRHPHHKVCREKQVSSALEIYDREIISPNTQLLSEESDEVVESEHEIKLTEFIPTKIYLKKEVKSKAMEAVNHTVTTKSPKGDVISKVRVCSLGSDPGSPGCISL